MQKTLPGETVFQQGSVQWITTSQGRGKLTNSISVPAFKTRSFRSHLGTCFLLPLHVPSQKNIVPTISGVQKP